MNKKLQLETKIRDAALSLSKANASYKDVSKQSSEQLDNANRKVEAAQKELWKISERVNEVQRKLLEHNASVLSYSLRSLEKKTAHDSNSGDTSTNSGYSTPNRTSQMSPTASSMTSVQSSATKARFEHFFAGHSDAVTPQTPRRPPTSSEVQELEGKLKAATSALEAANAKQAELSRALGMAKLEKDQVETALSMDLQQAEETINALEKESQRWEAVEAEFKDLKEEKAKWEQEQVELEARRREVDSLQQQLGLLRKRNGEASQIETALANEREAHQAELEAKAREVAQTKEAWEADRAAWDLEKATLESQIQQSASKVLDASLAGEHKVKLDEAFEELRDLVQVHGILLVTREPSVSGMIASVGHHLENLSIKLAANTRAQEEWAAVRTKLEEDVRSGLDKREALYEELDKVRKERDEAKSELQAQLQVRFCMICSFPSLIVFYRIALSPRLHLRKPSTAQWNTLATPRRSLQSSNPSGKSSPHQKPVQANTTPDSGLVRQCRQLAHLSH